MTTLSVIIITKNEAHRIRDCLASVSFADEIIVVDSGSTDDTVAICREYTDNVIETDWPGFGPQKNRALARASSEWVLSLDADERVSDALREEILQSLQSPAADGFYILRSSTFCKRFIRYSHWQNDYVLRLFKREMGRFSDDKVHEKVIVSGNSKKLKHTLLHFASDSLDEIIQKMNLYSSLGADMLNERGRKTSLTSAITHGLWAFIRTYIVKRGFLDGREGFMLAISVAEASYYRYAKLLLLQKHNQNT